MTFARGTSVGPYEIVALLGAGGMGEVYRARDARLRREVAIKFLLGGRPRDADGLERFQREARAVSALNDPNILTIFDVGEHEGAPYLVTELLDGQSLRDQLRLGTLPAGKAVEIAIGVARGLAAAHAKGIVHRDIKPENLFLTKSGGVKILDFGLAKIYAADPAARDEATTAALTAEGLIVGTLGYLSPEQVRNEPVDHRTDVFAFGAVLYEMLAGRRPFAGGTTPELLSSILRDDVTPVTGSDPLLPALNRLIRRCLEKPPDSRIQSMRDVVFVLEDLQTGAPAIAVAAPTRSVSRSRWPWLVAAILTGIAAVTGYVAGHRSTPAPLSWSGTQWMGGSLIVYAPRISPDGQTLAFLLVVDRQSQIAVMKPGSGRWTVLTRDRSHGPAVSLSWSQDGRLLYYQRAGVGVFSVPAPGGEERAVLEDASAPESLPDGSLLVLRRVDGGQLVQLHRHRPEQGRTEAIGPKFLPRSTPTPNEQVRAFRDGKQAVFFGQLADDRSGDGPGPYVIDLSSGSARRLAPSVRFPPDVDIAKPALAIDPTTDDVLLVVPDGDLRQIVAIPLSAPTPPRAILHLTATPWFIDVDRDGSLLVDQFSVSGYVLRFGERGGSPRRVARLSGLATTASSPIDLPDGSVLFASTRAGRSVVYRAWPGRDPVPFLDVNDETTGPMTLVGTDRVAMLAGPATRREIALANIDGRLLQRLTPPVPGVPTSLATLAGGHLLYNADRQLFDIDSASGASRRIAGATLAAADPRTGDFLIRPGGDRRLYLERTSLDGAHRADIGRFGNLYPATWNGRVVDRAGRLLITFGTGDSWMLGPAIVNSSTGALQPIALEFSGDVLSPNWALDGSVLAIGWEYTTGVWQFKRIGAR